MPGTTARISALLPSWELSLSERDLSPKTIEVYLRTGTQLAAWLERNGLPDRVGEIEAKHLRAFIAAETERTSAISAHQHFRNLRVLFRWLVREEEIDGPSPVDRVEGPKVTRKVKPILADSQLAAILRTCEGTPVFRGRKLAVFEQRRDLAILRIMIDTGVRVSGIGNVKTSDVRLPHKTIRVVLKGGDEHTLPLGRKAAAALDRYLRARARHRHADSPWLWLGMAGRDPGHFGPGGIQDMIERRAAMAGITEAVTPHWFRRTFAHDWLAGGGSEMDGMSIGGWKTRRMFGEYAGDLADERAREAHARLSPGDRL